jgi:predicted enzyme related to lactoylglutathione lyase
MRRRQTRDGNPRAQRHRLLKTPDVLAEHRRLRALGVDVDPEPVRTPGAPLLFMMRDPDGNHIAVVEAPPAD